MLVVYRCDGTADVYVNELQVKAQVRAKGRVEAGDPVMKDDIAAIEYMDFGVTVPEDAGFLFLFSVGWRRGLYYDFGPIFMPNPLKRRYDIGRLLGQAYCRVLFQERFSISDADWDRLFEAQWFPFVGLRSSTVDDLINHVQSGLDPDRLLDQVAEETRIGVTQMAESWRSRVSFRLHMPFLERAIERFLADDPTSCTALLFPRIEGILRSHHAQLGSPGKPHRDNLVQTAMNSAIRDDNDSLLLPRRFRDYLRNVYFANFRPEDESVKISRDSVGHGVAAAAAFDRKSALIGLLIVQQLFYFLGEANGGEPEEGAASGTD